MHACGISPVAFRVGLAVCGVGVGSYVMAALQLSPGADLSRHVGWFLVSFLFYLVAVGLVLARGRPGADVQEAEASAGGSGDGRLKPQPPGERRRLELALVLGIAVLLRAGLMATVPSLSDDVFRYVWDGKIVNAGINPYLYPPSAPELASLRGPLWEGINHKPMPTPYPPLAEALFAGVYRLVPESLMAMQAMAVVFDLGVVALLVLMLACAGRDPLRVLIYAWNPLVLVQYAHSAHYDAAMILPLLGAIYLLRWGMRAASGALLGLSTLVKLVPAAAGPLFVPLWGVSGLGTMGVVAAAGLLPWVWAGAAQGGLASEAADARFNDSLGYLLNRLLGLAVPNPDVPARAASLALFGAGALLLAALMWRRKADWTGVLVATYQLLGLFLLLNAVVEPWYLAWLVPFLCFTLESTSGGLPRLQPALGWLLLSGLVVLTDLTYLPGGNSHWAWVRAIEYGPLYALLALTAWRKMRRLAGAR